MSAHAEKVAAAPTPSIDRVRRVLYDLAAVAVVLLAFEMVATERLVTRLVPGATCAAHGWLMVRAAEAQVLAKAAAPPPAKPAPKPPAAPTPEAKP